MIVKTETFKVIYFSDIPEEIIPDHWYEMISDGNYTAFWVYSDNAVAIQPSYKPIRDFLLEIGLKPGEKFLVDASA